MGNPCLFTGQRYDDETGFYWCKSRYLESRTGRFTSRDPIGLWGDPLNLGNPYTFTGNNPWSWLDPYGLCGKGTGDDWKDALDDEWWTDFGNAFWDLTINDPWGFGSDVLDAGWGYFVDGPLGLGMAAAELSTPFGQLDLALGYGNLAYNLATDFRGTLGGALSDYYEGWFNPRVGGAQAFNLAAASAGGYYVGGLAPSLSRTAPATERLVIGRGRDLRAPGALGPGEFRLSWPPTGSVRSEWRVNSGLMRQEMRNRRPIRDASPGDNGGMYLNLERNLLRDRGWWFEEVTSLWIPPSA